MRSRYSAHVLADKAYLAETWHPDFRPADLANDDRIKWIGLEVISSQQHDRQASIEFEARYISDGRVEALHEKSAFVSDQGRWLYTSGEMLAATFESWKPGRNASCPCGSGKKFKRCCAPER